MGYAMNFYHDQVVAGGEAGVPLPPAHRMIFVRHGRVRVGDVVLDSGDSLFAPDEMIVTSEDEWSQVWRWEIAPVSANPVRVEGMGRLSHLPMSCARARAGARGCRQAGRGRRGGLLGLPRPGLPSGGNGG